MGHVGKDRSHCMKEVGKEPMLKLVPTLWRVHMPQGFVCQGINALGATREAAVSFTQHAEGPPHGSSQEAEGILPPLPFAMSLALNRSERV